MRNTAAEHVRKIVKQLSELEAELAKLSERVKRTQELLRYSVLKNWSVPPARLEERPYLESQHHPARRTR